MYHVILIKIIYHNSLSGVGKTSLLKMVAVRLAKQLKTNISFINVNSATMLDKYVGETQKLIDTLYRVADKFSPTLICVDEVSFMKINLF